MTAPKVIWLVETPTAFWFSREELFDQPDNVTVTKMVAAQPEQEPTYISTQATKCAGCKEHKHTPLRIDAMGGYVCLTCIDKKLGSLLGEFGYAQPDQEPVAWANPNDLQNFDMKVRTSGGPLHTVPLYTTPPQRTWVGLMDEEIWQTVTDCTIGGDLHADKFAKAIEAKLRSKNNA